MDRKNTEMERIVELASVYAGAHRALADTVRRLRRDTESLALARLPRIRGLASEAANARAELVATIADRPDLFERPRTRLIDGVKVGIRKQPGRVQIDDEERVIARIRARLPAEQAELLIRRRENVDKRAVSDLTAADLKRLGIRVGDDEDVVIVDSQDREIERYVTKLLQDATPSEAVAR